MRLKIAWVILLMALPAPSQAQTVECQLFGEDYGYGLFGTCRAGAAPAPPTNAVHSQRLRYWPEGDVNIVVSARPNEGGPWRGYFFVGSGTGWTDSFEITKEPGLSGAPLMLRSMVGWVVVHRWERAGRGTATLAFLLNYPRATADDVTILRSALGRLSSSAAWDRNDDRDCENDAQGQGSLFCVLQSTVAAQRGRYHHAQPALDIVRRIILERWADRVNRGHAFTNFNNHLATTLEDVRDVINEALRRAADEEGRAR